MIPTKLIEPIIPDNNWWEQYEEINSSLFTHENSARRMGCPEIYRLSDDNKLVPVKWSGSEKFSVFGYTLNPPLFDYRYNIEEYVGIMFENTETFEKVWFHFFK